MKDPMLYDISTFREAVDYDVFRDIDGYGEALENGVLVDPFVKPSDIDVLPKSITHIRWRGR